MSPSRGADGAVVVTGGAGFVGSWLCERLLGDGREVWCVDNLVTGSLDNVRRLTGDRRFRFLEADVTESLSVDGPVAAVLHLASPASPRHYAALPLETLAVGSRGTEHALDLAERCGARFLLASTSEVYGDPQVHPQPEDYPGHVNPIGPRSVYDEAKRFAEALTFAYRRHRGVDTTVARIFNTYGPRMAVDDGRLVPTFVEQALSGAPLTVAGDGSQTRSLCWVGDLVEGLVRLLDSGDAGPVNLGSEDETTVLEVAELVREVTGSDSPIVHVDLPEDDPKVRRPDLTRARQLLDWQPRMPLREGLLRTVEWCAKQRAAA